MKVFKTPLLILFLAVYLQSCSQNIFSELASKSSDESLLFDAKAFVDRQEYQSALDTISKMTASGQVDPSAKEVTASAYAGLCGLNFINFVDSLSQQTSGTAFTIVASPFVGRVISPPHCLNALNTLQSIGDTPQRTAYQNGMASLIGMSLMGSSTRLYTDNTPVDGDGTQDSAGISCSLTDTQVDYIVLGFGFMSKNFSYLSVSQLGSSSQTTLDSVIDTCRLVAGSDCEITDPSSITPTIRNTIKDLMNTSDYGVGTVNTGGDPFLIGASCL